MKYCSIIFFLFLPLAVKSQGKFIPQWHAWFRYYNQIQLSDKLVLHTEVDERKLLNPYLQFQFFSHVHLHYRWKPWLDVAAGACYELTNSTVNTSLAVPELRPWQEASLIKKIGQKLQFQFRYRSDERFIHRNDKVVLNDGYNFNWRHRFRIQFGLPIVQFADNRSLTLKFSDEVMIYSGNVADKFDQNRIYTSMEYKFNDRWSVESGYLNLIQSRTDGRFYERNVIRTTLYHRLDFRKKE